MSLKFIYVFLSIAGLNWSISSVLGTSSNFDVRGKSSCPLQVRGGVDWILDVRHSDYGWKENTHRAIIALVVSDWESFTSESERILMEQQLEVEITKSLLRNSSFPVYPNNLALYVHALLAVNRNPRNFHGIDLVADLMEHSHPFILLALCNAKSLNRHHFSTLEYSFRSHFNSHPDIEYKALVLQAYECAKSLNFVVNETLLMESRRHLVSQQHPDGSFGNVYTTAFIVQALAPAPNLKWNKDGALKYLEKQSLLEINMVSTYLIQLALNAERIKFIKDIHPQLTMDRMSVKKVENFFIRYSLRVGLRPNVYHTITINVPPNSNFFEIMQLASDNDPKYNFSYYMDKKKEPSVFAISDVPNDAEENLYWRLCVQANIDHDSHRNRHQDRNRQDVRTFQQSPIHLYPKTDQHVIYWYLDRDCEEA